MGICKRPNVGVIEVAVLLEESGCRQTPAHWISNRRFHPTKSIGTPLAAAKVAPTDFAGEPNVRQANKSLSGGNVAGERTS